MFRREMRAKEAEAANKKDEDNVRPTGVYIQNDDVKTSGRPVGNSAAAALRRLRRARPDIHQRVLAMLEQALAGEEATQAEAVDAPHRDRPAGLNQHTVVVYNEEHGVHDHKERPAGNSVAAALRRLHKDRPDIHARVLAGEITAHAGMVEAGPNSAAVFPCRSQFAARARIRGGRPRSGRPSVSAQRP
jgi:hypothetical protein